MSSWSVLVGPVRRIRGESARQAPPWAPGKSSTRSPSVMIAGRNCARYPPNLYGRRSLSDCQLRHAHWAVLRWPWGRSRKVHSGRNRSRCPSRGSASAGWPLAGERVGRGALSGRPFPAGHVTTVDRSLLSRMTLPAPVVQHSQTQDSLTLSQPLSELPDVRLLGQQIIEYFRRIQKLAFHRCTLGSKQRLITA